MPENAQFNDVYSVSVQSGEFKAGLEQLEAIYTEFLQRLNAKSIEFGFDFSSFQNLTKNLQDVSGSIGQTLSTLVSDIDASVTKVQAAASRLNDTAAGKTSSTSVAPVEAPKEEAKAWKEVENSVNSATNATAAHSKKNETTLGEDLLRVAKFALMWQAVGFAINGVQELLSLPFKAVENGLKYLEDTQKAADRLTGVLAQNVKFTEDQANNFKLAAEAAPQVARALQDIAAKDNLKFEGLNNIFNALAQNGAADAVKSLTGMVRLSEIFAVTIAESGKSATATRSAISEIDKAFAGGLKDGSSQFLKVIGLTSEEWYKMLAASKEHGDLLTRLEPYVTKYMGAVQAAEYHHEALSQKLKYFIERWEGLVAGPLFSTLTGWLDNIIRKIEENSGAITAWGVNLGLLVNDIARVGDAFGGVGHVVSGIGKLIGLMAAEAAMLVDALVTGTKIDVASTQDRPDLAEQYANDFNKRQADRKRTVDALFDPEARKRLVAQESADKIEAQQAAIKVETDSIAKAEAAKVAAIESAKQAAKAAAKAKHSGTPADKEAARQAKTKAEIDATKATEEAKWAAKATVAVAGQKADLDRAVVAQAVVAAATAEAADKEAAAAKAHADKLAKIVSDKQWLSSSVNSSGVAQSEKDELAKAQAAATQAAWRAAEADAIAKSAKQAAAGHMDDHIGSNKANVVKDGAATKIKSDLSEISSQFSNELEKIKTEYQDKYEAISKAVASGAMSHQTALPLVLADLAAETDAVDTLVAAKQALIEADKGATRQQKNSAENHLDTTGVREDAALKKQASRAQDAADKEALDIAKDASKGRIALAEQEARKILAIQKEQAAEGFYTEQQVIQLEIEEAEKLHNIKLREYEERKIGLDPTGRTVSDINNVLTPKENADYGEKKILLQERLNAAKDKEAQYAANALAREKDIAAERATALRQLDELTTRQLRDGEAEFKLREEQLSLTLKQKQAELDILSIRNAESNKVRDLLNDIRQINAQRLQNLANGIASIEQSDRAPWQKDNAERELANSANDEAQAQLLGASRARINATQKDGETPEAFAKRLKLLDDAVTEAAKAYQGTNKAVSDLEPGWDKLKQNLEETFLGPNFTQHWSKANGAVEKMAVGAEGAAHAMLQLENITAAYSQGAARGGTLGGAGAVISGAGGLAKDIGGLAGVKGGAIGKIFSKAGPWAEVIGVGFTIIGDLLTAHARHIAEAAQKEFDKTIQAFQNGSLSLNQTLNQVQAERADAISRLSGVKGGKDQLDKLLPTFDNEIAQLIKQKTDILANFDLALTNLKLQSETLSGLNQQWTDINKKVKEYLDAGGEMVKAQAFISLQLQQIQKTNQDNLNQGQQQAIQDAINLNGLLKQKVDLLKQQDQALFNAATADALERRGTGAIDRALQVSQAKQQQQDQLDSLNAQISVATKKVAAEQTVFTIATDLASLRRQDESLTLIALNQQIQKYKDMQAIVAGITQTNGLFSLANGLIPAGNTTTTTNIAVTITGGGGNHSPSDPYGPGGWDGRRIGGDIADEIQRRMRQYPGR